MVKNIRSGTAGSFPSYLTNVNGTLFFSADNGTNGYELWKSDGTDAGTVLVKDINSFDNSSPRYLTNVNGTLFFRANNVTNGDELWKSDGTDAGTVLVKDILSGASGSFPTYLTNVNGMLFFRATNGTTGQELWKSDGTDAGTFQVEDIHGTSGSLPSNFTNVNGTLFFRADNGTIGGELWRWINEAPTDVALSASSLPENAGANATVGSLSTTDPDAGNTFTYTLVSGTGDVDNSAFNVSGSTLRATSSFDLETKSSYTIRVRSTDQGGLSTDQTFTITVTNVNESPTDLALSSTTLAENSGANATVGLLSTVDPDLGDSFTYTLIAGAGGTDNGAFNISGNTLRATGNLDFENKSSYSIRVKTQDQFGLAFEKSFTILVTNAIELVSAVVNGGNSFANPLQRSQITSLVVTTDLPLTDPSTAFTLTNIGLYTASESVLSASQILVTNVGNVYTLRFGPGSGVVTRQGSGTRGNSLADGNWVLKVTQATGANQYGHRAVDKFFRMFGDSDGDGDVDGTDVLALRRAQLAASYNAALDWDGNGSVSAGVDLSNFGLNQNKRRRSF
jgi:ELWxxDGT repeat protein